MSNYPKPDNETLLEIYRTANLIKQNDERIIKLMMAGKLVMPYYSPRGQEIIPSAVSASLEDDDYICTIYRGLHDMLAKGFPLDEMWAELAGRETGTCKGKGGPMHLTCPERGMMVTTGIVGSSMPIATGLGWAAKLDGKNRVSVANFGDGAANIGAFHESLNMAALYELPVIFICQNNRYAEHTSFDDSSKVETISIRAEGYGMPGVTVNGNDPDEMYGAAKVAIDRARAGEGPTLIEATTFRFNGHLLGESGAYMDKDLYAQAQADDPMPILRKRLVDEGIASEDEIAAIEADITARIDAAQKAAFDAPFPDVIELKRDVYAEEID
ncbi:acetoin:2,6-dichlorophenolindophenol oxidoreductase subunit alpha [Novosphingobium marinum]|uniref:Pyruvate dehydrogenase E1 component alpha subunit n=1 Tax=Novosphingobium marinum TaxID=1514948 RepID=A0A7Z0BSB5_9SPHN|nr:thiamine pyrophosphate-dependent dehydrogenase E1 component subunit alpha [Novosphingobium marinum]NYH93979.1 pyruvate dehydrogenase E1 component alpha subunit [Novosphingobium marinum]GGC18701.1 acetoin:2,6-dichlorophenolindophenol oxidoreductase subunit alpha [Novosphingobium marinum]